MQVFYVGTFGDMDKFIYHCAGCGDVEMSLSAHHLRTDWRSEKRHAIDFSVAF